MNDIELQPNKFCKQPERDKVKVGQSLYFNLKVQNEQGQNVWQTFKAKIRIRYADSFAISFMQDGEEKWATFPKRVLYVNRKDAETDVQNEPRKRLFDES